LHVQDTEEGDTSSEGGYMSDADPYRYNFIQAGDCVWYFDRVNYREEEQGWISSINEGRQGVAVQIEGSIDCLHFGDYIKVLCRRTENKKLITISKPSWETISSRTTIGRRTYTSGVVSSRNRAMRESMASAQRDIDNF
jgi:hypothetical protein